MSPQSETIDMGEELRGLIAARIENHERSLQKIIGASEIGTPCVRKLALKLLQTPAVPEQNNGEDKWRATVGTAVHVWLAEMLRAANARHYTDGTHDVDAGGNCRAPWCDYFSDADKPEHKDRWLVELRTPIGTIDGEEVPGSLDVYDRLTKTIVDWKIVGPTAIKEYKKARHPGLAYEIQGQLYGRGLSRVKGEDVQWVGVMFLPSNGELKSYFYWETEFDPEVGKEALRRAREIKNLVEKEGLGIIAKLKTTDDHCANCPFFSPDTDDLEHECPGDPSLMANADEAFSDILPNG